MLAVDPAEGSVLAVDPTEGSVLAVDPTEDSVLAVAIFEAFTVKKENIQKLLSKEQELHNSSLFNERVRFRMLYPGQGCEKFYRK